MRLKLWIIIPLAVSGIVGAIQFMSQTTLDETLSTLSTWSPSKWFQYFQIDTLWDVFLVVIAALCLLWFFSFLFKWNKNRDLISLQEAAKRAYRKFEECNPSWITVAERASVSSWSREEMMLHFLAKTFIRENETPLFGKRYEYAKEIPIPFREVCGCDLDREITSLINRDGEIEYMELRISWNYVQKVIDSMCKNPIREVALNALLNQSQAAPLEVEKRIPFIDFIRQAGQRGLDLNDDDAVNNLCQELRQAAIQAAIDEVLEIYGRKSYQFEPPIILIPKEYWHEFQINYTRAFEFTGKDGRVIAISTNNALVVTHDISNSNSEEEYFDIHLNREEAMKVLENWITKYVMQVMNKQKQRQKK